MIGAVRAWLDRHASEVKLAFRVTVSGLLAFALAELFGLAQGYWAVITAVIVVQSSIGGSLKAGGDRLLGTVGGAAYGALIGVLVPHAEPVIRGAALAAGIAPLALLAAINTSFRMAPVTAAIVLLSSASGGAGPLASAVARSLEIGLGCIVGITVSLLVLPARAHGLLAKAASRGLQLQAELLGAASERLAGTGEAKRLQEINDRIAAVQRRLDAVGREVERERRSGLTGTPDPDPLIRSLRRLRRDLIVIVRAGAAPLPAPAQSLLAPAFADVIDTVSEALRGTAEVLAARRDTPEIEGALAALERYAAAMDGFRQAQSTLELPASEAERIFALSFALAQLRDDLRDLALRASDFAGRAPTAA